MFNSYWKEEEESNEYEPEQHQSVGIDHSYASEQIARGEARTGPAQLTDNDADAGPPSQPVAGELEAPHCCLEQQHECYDFVNLLAPLVEQFDEHQSAGQPRGKIIRCTYSSCFSRMVSFHFHLTSH